MVGCSVAYTKPSSHFLPCQDPFFNSSVDHELSEPNDLRVPTWILLALQRPLRSLVKLGVRVTGVDLRHLLLLLPFLLFDLLDTEIGNYNAAHGTDLVNPAHQLIKLVLALLECYHLLRRTGKTMIDLVRLEMLGKIFVDMCAVVFCMRKFGNLLYLCCEKVHSVLHSASEIMRWGDLINTSGEAPEQSHKINVKAPGKNLNHRSSDGKTLLGHARKKLCAQMLGSAIQGI